jgi:hypothetical protein
MLTAVDKEGKRAKIEVLSWFGGRSELRESGLQGLKNSLIDRVSSDLNVGPPFRFQIATPPGSAKRLGASPRLAPRPRHTIYMG